LEICNLDSLMKEDLYTKSRILDCILSYLVANELIGADYKDFHKNFYNKIIVYRNALAHQNSDEKKLYIKDIDQYIDVNQELFYRIKDSIIEYITIFYNISHFIKESKEETDYKDVCKELVTVS